MHVAVWHKHSLCDLLVEFDLLIGHHGLTESKMNNTNAMAWVKGQGADLGAGDLGRMDG